MHRMNGLETTRRLRAHETKHGLDRHVVMLNSSTLDERDKTDEKFDVVVDKAGLGKLGTQDLRYFIAEMLLQRHGLRDEVTQSIDQRYAPDITTEQFLQLIQKLKAPHLDRLKRDGSDGGSTGSPSSIEVAPKKDCGDCIANACTTLWKFVCCGGCYGTADEENNEANTPRNVAHIESGSP